MDRVTRLYVTLGHNGTMPGALTMDIEPKKYPVTHALLALWEQPWSGKRMKWAFWALRHAEHKGIPPVIER